MRIRRLKLEIMMLYSLRLLQLQMSMGLEGMSSGPSKAILNTFETSPFPETGKSFMRITSCFLKDKVFFCNKLEK